MTDPSYDGGDRRCTLICSGHGDSGLGGELPGLAGEAKSYAERLFKFPMIGELPPEAAAEALVEPARAEGVRFEEAAVALITEYTEGYPYFIQEFGRAVWNLAEGPEITREDADAALSIVEGELDESFFRARVQRSTPEELRYMRAMPRWGAMRRRQLMLRMCWAKLRSRSLHSGRA